MFLRTVERAGGDDVWVKGLHYQRGFEAGESWAEVMVAARARQEAQEAIEREAIAQKLETRIRHDPPKAGQESTWIVFESHGRNLGSIHWVEVPRILEAAIIIDDLGQNLAAARDLAGLHYPLTFSIMPRVRFARETAEAAHRSGHEVMLHLPMQPLPSSHASVSAYQIRVGMTRSEVVTAVEQDLSDVPFVAGVNNHMGSEATSNPELMESVMAVLASRHLYFIDSRTTANTVALDVARRSGVPAFYRSVFLDDSQDVNYTLGQLRRLCAVARKQGGAIAIGHPYPTTLAALAKFLPEFEGENIRLVPASRLARSPEFARIDPPRPQR